MALVKPTILLREPDVVAMLDTTPITIIAMATFERQRSQSEASAGLATRFRDLESLSTSTLSDMTPRLVTQCLGNETSALSNAYHDLRRNTSVYTTDARSSDLLRTRKLQRIRYIQMNKHKHELSWKSLPMRCDATKRPNSHFTHFNYTPIFEGFLTPT